ncbi:MAG: SDR family oxidoreductase [Patescibacteria group bacterium]|jgi:NAD(P)-dependent dehydrogenase (short-subunit alcohol dehydrogenase family)
MPVALITGSAKGLGKTLALALAKQGYTIIVHYRTSVVAAQQVLTQVKHYTPQSIILSADLTKEAEVKQLFNSIKKQYGKLDVLINNVGELGSYQLLSKLTLQDWQTVLASNLFSVALCTKQAVPLLKKSQAGRIINISCAGAEQLAAKRYTVPYFIAKTGVIILTKSWAKLLAQTYITVNYLTPGVLPNSVRLPSQASRQRASFSGMITAVHQLLS